MKYISTRGKSPELNFSDVLLGGLAPDGGLYLPKSYPKFTVNDAVVDLQRAFANGQLPNSLTDPAYFNIQRMNEILSVTDSDGEA